LFSHLGLPPQRGLLLYGPSGSGLLSHLHTIIHYHTQSHTHMYIYIFTLFALQLIFSHTFSHSQTSLSYLHPLFAFK
jgi:hypothetical protein